MFPTRTEIDKKNRFLCWNCIGSITLRDEMDVKLIDIEYSNSNMKSILSIPIMHSFEMACLNYHGSLLASKPIKTNFDEYKEEDINDDEKYSFL